GLGSYVPPGTETEQQLVGIWETVLERRGIGVTDDFFALGGYSLKVLKLAALVQERMSLELPLLAVFKAPTVRDLARCLVVQAAFGVAGLDEAMVLMGGDRGQPLFAFPPGRSDALGYTRLAAALGCPFFGFNFIEADSRLQEYVDLILSVDPQGPYRLFGYSGGGRLAYHVAAVLEGQGRVVSDII